MKKFRIPFFIIGSIVFFVFVYVSYFLPLTIPPLASSLVIRDVHDEEIGEIIADKRIRHRDIAFDDIPSFYLSGLLWIEDRDFWDNSGISYRGVARSLLHNIRAWRIVEWASTISAQLVRNALWINEDRDLMHKLLESLYAIRINHILSKKEILTEYVNRIGFGYMNFGLRSASLYYFGKEPKHLTEAEQVALLIIPKNPNVYDPFLHPVAFQKRYVKLLNTFESGGVLNSTDRARIGSEHLDFLTKHTPILPYVTDFIRSSLSGSEQSPGVLVTTFDLGLTKRIDTIAQSILDRLSWRNVSDYGILIAERTPSGPALRVMIGGKNYHESERWQVNTTLALRQPGSTIKPFTYLLAFQNLGYTPESMMTDLPVHYATAEGYAYEPKNYSQKYSGEVSLREALSQSINIPAVKLLEQVGVQTLLDFLHTIGITSLRESSDHYGLALTLGDGEVTLFELLQAYSIFAYDGQYCPITFTLSGGSLCHQVVDQKYIDRINSILMDRYAKLPEFPINSSLDFADRRVALKTGTSRNFRDNWTIGFTDHYMIGVWTGNKSGENMKWVSGATWAWEIFAKIVYALEPEETIPEIHESKKESLPFLTITSPLGGSVYERDPLKVESLQEIALRFRTNVSYDKVNWTINGKPIEKENFTLYPGIYIFEIALQKDGKNIASEKSSITVHDRE